MIDGIKKALQKPLIKKRHRLYEARIGKQTVPYDVWIRNVLEEERKGITKQDIQSAEQKVRILDFSQPDFVSSMQNLLENQLDDSEMLPIYLFTAKQNNLVETAAAQVYCFLENNPECQICYGDEKYWFKPGWSPDTLQSYFYFGNVFAIRGEALEVVKEKVSWASPEILLYSLVLAVTDLAPAGHLDEILYLGEKTDRWGMTAEFDAVKRGHRYSDVDIMDKNFPNDNFTDTELPGTELPLVSVIIPSKDNPCVLSHCIHSLLEITTYPNLEIIVVDNGSAEENRRTILRMQEQLKQEFTFQYLYEKIPFNFSRMCNLGAKAAKGEYLLFLNDDMEIFKPNWLCAMMQKAMKEYVGAVGAKLLYPSSDKIQHVGITNIHLGPAHKLQFAQDHQEYYYGYNHSAVNVSAVTGACLLVKKRIWQELGGWNEQLQVAFNDVEFCYHMMEKGYTNVSCNQVALYHHESLSRGSDAGIEKVTRLHQERDLLYQLHPQIWNRDDYYNRHFVTDILDKGFEPRLRFDETIQSVHAVPREMTGLILPQWENESLYMGIEFAGSRQQWLSGIADKKEQKDYYIQGWSFAINVDNSRYETTLLLKQIIKKDDSLDSPNERIWGVPYEACYRPDQEENLPYIDHPGLSGLSVWISGESIPKGTYLIGYLWEDICSRQKLFGYTAETLVIN